MPTVKLLAVGLVVTVNVPVEEPAGITTVDGIVTKLGAPVDRLTVQPPVGAGALRLIVPVELVPAEIDDGLIETPVKESPRTDKLVLCQITLSCALIKIVIVGVVFSGVIVNVAEVCPSGTVTVAGTPR